MSIQRASCVLICRRITSHGITKNIPHTRSGIIGYHSSAVNRILSDDNKLIHPHTNVSKSSIAFRFFQVRGSGAPINTQETNEQLLHNKQVSQDEVDKTVSDLSKRLKLSQKEAISIRLGLQEGLRLQSTAARNQAKINDLRKFLIKVIIVGSIVIFLLGTVSIKFASTSPLKKLVSFGKTDFKAEIPDVSFDDVKGIDEVKQELQDVVEFLKDPDRFTNLGGKLPKGMLLVGPPGTGKTLLARAIAGEAKVPFYYASGSEFDEMFVGVGSSRIRGLFAEARENAPCIIFIDEIDACGDARTSSPLQPYARQTINQLLQEMDGFKSKESVIVLGATNMGKVLDKALTRPGRFDTEINVMPPDIKGRKEILELYVKKTVHDSDIDLDSIACLTGGMTGADLSNLVNQAALRAAQLHKEFVEMEDFEHALDKLRMGPELKSRLRTEKELLNTAFHEAGHALVAYHTSGALPIFKVTISQRGGALGHTSLIPTRDDELSTTNAKIRAQIDVAMGGRVAEEILSGKENVTTGASNDLDVATKLAYKLVCNFGMSETLGFVAYDYDNVSPENKRIIETEVNTILTDSYTRAKKLLSKYGQQHKLLAQALLKYETLTQEEMKVLFTQNSIEAIANLRKSQQIPPTPNSILPSAKDLPAVDVLM
ncbi:ATP-dependent zinc metalloprotease YME1L1-like [Styela clava]